MAKKNPIIVEEQITDNKDTLQIEELTNRWKRVLADYQNLEKRYEREKSDFVQFANANLILKLISVLGHLEKAVEVLNDRGLEMTVSELKRILLEEGLEEIDSLGKEFNPEFMEAIEVVAGEKDNTVAEVVNKGYLLKGKLLVPSKVKVFRQHSVDRYKEKLAKDQLLKGDYM